MKLKSGKIEGFDHLSHFSTLKEFNRHVEMWLAVHKHDFSKGEMVGLKRLVRFSAKIPGVCNAKIGTILKAIHEEFNKNGISRSTFKRMIQKGIELGIITVYETKRNNGSQSSNLYVFNRFPKHEPPTKEKMDHHETSNPSKTNTNKIMKRKEKVQNFDHTYTSDRVPQTFVQLVKHFFLDPKTIEEYWQMASISAYRNNREKEKEQVLTTAIHSFKQLIRKLKSKAQIKNPIAYFYGILDKKFEELYFQELLEMGF